MSAVTPPECVSRPGSGRNVPKRSAPRGEDLCCICSTGELAQRNPFRSFDSFIHSFQMFWEVETGVVTVRWCSYKSVLNKYNLMICDIDSLF